MPAEAPNTDIAIIGAGPHALTFAAYLLQKRQKLRQRFAVFDPSGMWLQQWQQQFAAFEIPHLRSPAVHHPDPNPYALRRFAEFRPQELFAPYDLPGTQLFQDFCADLIRRLELPPLLKAKVLRIEPLQHRLHPRFRLWLADDRVAIARRIVFAKGSSQIHMPEWVSQIQSLYPPERLCHSQKVDLQKLHLAGERILIVGGGLTSGHLAVGAIARGAKVVLMARRKLQEKLFDAEPGWLGPKYLKDFWAEPDWEKRWYLIQQARNGGSLTPAMMLQLRRLMRRDRLQIRERCQVVKVAWQENNWLVHCHDDSREAIPSVSQHEFDRIWVATGTQLDVTAEPLLTEILDTFPTPVVRGLPVLSPCLQWSGCKLYVMGGLAALQVGPTARNLSGARMASERIVSAF